MLVKDSVCMMLVYLMSNLKSIVCHAAIDDDAQVQAFEEECDT